MTEMFRNNNLAAVRRQGAKAALTTVLSGKNPTKANQLLGIFKSMMREAAAYDLAGTANSAMDELMVLGLLTDDLSGLAQRVVADVAVELAVDLAGKLVAQRQNTDDDLVEYRELVASLAEIQGRIGAIAGTEVAISGIQYPLLPPAMTAAAQGKIRTYRASLG